MRRNLKKLAGIGIVFSNLAMAFPCLHVITGMKQLPPYAALTSSEHITHQCTDDKVAVFLLPTKKPGEIDHCRTSYDASLTQVQELFLSCVNPSNPIIEETKRLYRTTGSGFKITAGTSGRTSNLTIQAL